MRQPLIPQRYRTSVARELSQDLDRLAAAILAWAKGLPSELDIVPAVSLVGATTLAFGHALQLDPQEDDEIQLELRQPSIEDAGRTMTIFRQSRDGLIELVCTGGCTINGYSRLLLLGDIRTNIITTDGSNYYLDNGGALGWGTGLLP